MKRHLTLLFLISLFALPFSADAQLKINEVDYDQPSADSAEFIELYNAGTASVNLGDYSLILVNCNNNNFAPYATVTLPQQSLAPGAFFVICSGFGTVPNCSFSFSHAYNGGHIQNGTSATNIYPDLIAIQENSSQNYVDFLSYEGSCVSPYSGNGIPVAESDTVVAQDTINGIPQAPLKTFGVSRYPDGNDTDNDSIDFRRSCITPGGPNVNIASNCSTVGLFKPTSQQSISIYPNPSRGIIKIDTRDANLRHATVSVVDMLGNELRRNEIFPSNMVSEMNISDLPNGVYCIRVTGEDGKQRVQRLILRK